MLSHSLPKKPFTDYERLIITRRILEGEHFGTIARDFGIKERTVESIKRGRRWYQDNKDYILSKGFNSAVKKLQMEQ